jgi:hypothetical protein
VSVAQKLCSLLVLLVTIVAYPRVALADSTRTPTPGWTGSYDLHSPDDRYVLVMLGDMPISPGVEISAETARRNRLSLYYPVSGLYTNDCSINPLWTMPYISWRRHITLSSDGHHFFVWGEWPTDTRTYGDVALGFYEAGKVLSGYTVSDLVAQPTRLQHTVSHYFWLRDEHFDDARGLLTLETLNGEVHSFDVSTGKIISSVWATSEPVSLSRSSITQDPTPVATVGNAASSGHVGYGDDVSSAALLVSLFSLGLLFTAVSVLHQIKNRIRLRTAR